MAGAGLVPHELPDGRVVMVPDYLVPQGLRMPEAPAPAAGPDLRTASNDGPMAQWGNEIPIFPAQTQQEKEVADIRGALAPKAAPAPGANEHQTKPEPSKFQTLGVGSKGAQPGEVDPATLHRPQQGAPTQQGTDPLAGVSPAVRATLGDLGARGGGGGRSPGMVTASIQEKREPGKELIPELKWQYGLEQRPEVVDYDTPFDADSENPITYKPVETGLTRGAERYSQQGRVEFEREEAMRHEQALQQKAALVQQSQLLDSQLDTIAARRQRVAELQAVADRRAQEAASTDPKSRAEIWESKGSLAQGMALLAMAMGGYGQATTGHNAGREIIDSWLNGAVDDERYQFERRQKLGLEAKNDFEKAMALYGDLEVATLDVKSRKIASTMALAQQMMADKSLDESAKARGEQVQQALYQQALELAQQRNDLIQGKAVSQDITYKPGAPTGGGGGYDMVQRYERAARVKKAESTILGVADQPKPNPHEQAEMNAEEADMLPLKEMLRKYRNQDSIPGVGGRNIVSKGVRGIVDTVAGEGSGSRVLDTKEERANRIIVERAALAYRHKMTGAGGSAKEMAGIDQAFAGARTKEDLEEAVRVSEAALAERRRLAAGGRSRAADAPQRAASEEPDR